MYTQLPTNASILKNVPTAMAVAESAKIFAASMPVTGGVMLQAFRIFNGQVQEIPVDGQATVSPGQAVSVSPTGLHIVTSGQRARNRYDIWRYNVNTGRYYRQSSGSAFNNGYIITDFAWYDDYFFVGGMMNIDSGNTLGGMMAVTISDTSNTNTFNPAGAAANRATRAFFSQDRSRLIFGIGDTGSPSARVWRLGNNNDFILEQTFTPGFAIADYRNDLIVGSRYDGNTDVLKYSNGLSMKQANLASGVSSANFVFGDKLMLNKSNGSFAFYDLNPTTEQFTPTATIPKGLANIVATNRAYRWTRTTPINKLLIAYEYNKTEFSVFEVKDPGQITGNTLLPSPFKTNGSLAVTTSAKITTSLKSITTQLISGEDQSALSLNLKLNSAYVEAEPSGFGAFSYESFNMQYMHGRTRISRISTDGNLRIDNKIMMSDTLIPVITNDGIVALPPQFEGDTVIPPALTSGSLKPRDFLTGKTIFNTKFTVDGKIANGEVLEGQTIISGKFTTSAALKTDLGAFVDSTIPSIITEGLIQPTLAVFGDVEIDQITSTGFINNPWTINTETFIPNLETESFIANGEEGVKIANLLNDVMMDIVAFVFDPPIAQGDVSLPKITNDATLKAFQLYEARSAVIIDQLITEGRVNATSAVFGETFLPEFLIDGEVKLSVIADAVMLIPDIISDAIVMLMEGFDVNVKLNSVQTEGILEILKRKRHINIV